MPCWTFRGGPRRLNRASSLSPESVCPNGHALTFHVGVHLFGGARQLPQAKAAGSARHGRRLKRQLQGTAQRRLHRRIPSQRAQPNPPAGRRRARSHPLFVRGRDVRERGQCFALATPSARLPEARYCWTATYAPGDLATRQILHGRCGATIGDMLQPQSGALARSNSAAR